MAGRYGEAGAEADGHSDRRPDHGADRDQEDDASQRGESSKAAWPTSRSPTPIAQNECGDQESRETTPMTILNSRSPALEGFQAAGRGVRP